MSETDDTASWMTFDAAERQDQLLHSRSERVKLQKPTDTISTYFSTTGATTMDRGPWEPRQSHLVSHRGEANTKEVRLPPNEPRNLFHCVKTGASSQPAAN